MTCPKHDSYTDTNTPCVYCEVVRLRTELESLNKKSSYLDNVIESRNNEISKLREELEEAIQWEASAHELGGKLSDCRAELEVIKKENEIIRSTRNETCQTIEKLIQEKDELVLAFKGMDLRLGLSDIAETVDYFRKKARENGR